MLYLEIESALAFAANQLGKHVAQGKFPHFDKSNVWAAIHNAGNMIADNMDDPSIAGMVPMLGRVSDFYNVVEASIGRGNESDQCNLTVNNN